MLVFLTGQDEIERAVRDLVERVRALCADDAHLVASLAQPDLIALPLYAALPPDKQVSEAVILRKTRPWVVVNFFLFVFMIVVYLFRC